MLHLYFRFGMHLWDFLLMIDLGVLMGLGHHKSWTEPIFLSWFGLSWILDRIVLILVPIFWNLIGTCWIWFKGLGNCNPAWPNSHTHTHTHKIYWIGSCDIEIFLHYHCIYFPFYFECIGWWSWILGGSWYVQDTHSRHRLISQIGTMLITFGSPWSLSFVIYSNWDS